MYSYALLEPMCHYLIQEEKDSPITLIQVKAVSDTSMFIVKYDNTDNTAWKKKTDEIYDILELLSDNVVKEWTRAYYDNEDAYYEDDDE